jgi:starch synthase (maltosyl-transferring)
MYNEGVRIYNLFPRTNGCIHDWIEQIDHIKNMGFTHIFINPIYETGFSKSLYAPKNFYNINEIFIDIFSDVSPEEQMKLFLEKAKSNGLKVILEVILTHTAIDSDLILTNPEWFKYENGIPKRYAVRDKDSWVEWGDLVEIDNENSKKREELWNYWEKLLTYYIDMGFDGFKAEAAYKVPVELWTKLIKTLKQKNKDIILIGENLGSTFGEMVELTRAGFDYIFTSLKWWDFKASWLMEQHYEMKDFVGLISFPEYYNSERFASIHNKNDNAAKAWYALSALFNMGVMVTMGYEFGFVKKMEIVETFEEEAEKKNFDISEYIKKVNTIKKSYKIFNEENSIYIINNNNANIFILKKVSSDKKEEVLIIINKNFEHDEPVYIDNLKEMIEKTIIVDISPVDAEDYIPESYYRKMLPGEVRVILGF